MEGNNIFSTLELQTIECCNCHIVFAVPRELREQLKETHKTFYCPKGHPQYYTGKSNLEKWKEYSESIEKQLQCCKSDKEELFDEIKKIREDKKVLYKEITNLKRIKTRYKNKLKQI